MDIIKILEDHKNQVVQQIQTRFWTNPKSFIVEVTFTDCNYIDIWISHPDNDSMYYEAQYFVDRQEFMENIATLNNEFALFINKQTLPVWICPTIGDFDPDNPEALTKYMCFSVKASSRENASKRIALYTIDEASMKAVEAKVSNKKLLHLPMVKNVINKSLSFWAGSVIEETAANIRMLMS